jgi:hypothetical protein
VQAAYALADRLLGYRQNELQDPSRAAEFLEKAVHASSHADHREPVQNFAGYLVRRFTGIVDAFLKREKRVEYVDPQALANRYSTLHDELEQIENRTRMPHRWTLAGWWVSMPVAMLDSGIRLIGTTSAFLASRPSPPCFRQHLTSASAGDMAVAHSHIRLRLTRRLRRSGGRSAKLAQ